MSTATAQHEHKLRRVAISDLKPAPYNPKRRVTDKKMRILQRSIETVGLIYPIAVNQQNEIIDGHRRLAACRKLKWDTIPVIMVSGDREAIYAEVNAASCKMNGNDHLNIYLQCPSALPDRIHTYIKRIESIVGRSIITKMASRGASVSYYAWANQLAAYCERAGEVIFLKRCILWMLRRKCSKIAIAAINSGISPKLIERAVNRNQRLASTYAIAK